MSKDQSEIKQLVSQLESHLNHVELSIKKQIKVHSKSTDAELDDLFLSEDFNKHLLINNIQILKQFNAKLSSNDLENIENQCFDQATNRLKTYLELLNEHIIKIIESESDEFLQVAAKLESFKDILGDLKDSVKDFHSAFKNEKTQTQDIFAYMQQQYEELNIIIYEKEKLQNLVNIQEQFCQMEQLIKSYDIIAQQAAEDSYLELEQCIRILSDLKQSSVIDINTQQNLALVERDLTSKLMALTSNLIQKSQIFKHKSQSDEDQLYFEKCQLSSILRCFKLLQIQKSFFDLLQNYIVRPAINSLVKKAFDAKSNVISVMKGDKDQLLPFQIYINGIQTELLEGTLRSLLEITLTNEDDYNFVADFNVIQDCVWPIMIKSLDQQLSFVFSSGLQMFQKNFVIAKQFTEYLDKKFNLTSFADELILRFNVQTYLNVLVIENTDKFSQEIEKQFDQTNDSIKPLHQITISYAVKVLKDDLYLEEIGDKLIKLSIQFIVRHLNFVMDKVNERKSMATERILFILEDLSALQLDIKNILQPLILVRLSFMGGQKGDQEELQVKFVNPLLKELKLRFDLLAQPCIQGISTKIHQRLTENIQAFKQVPAMYRMTNRDVQNQPSQFLQNMLNPLQNLSEQKLFSTLSENVKHKLYDNVLQSCLKEISNLLEEILGEEKKMHESLMKYKKNNAGENVLTDYDKMLIQFYIVSQTQIYDLNIGYKRI
ncbi:ldlcp-related protein [Stylonychia lemnae]|uniref:Ldlcp-related protein n=1 Tax=Stylonychia lemnae TaxID=5949 RepID=A0A078ANH1_STYLE|nr:ldlcp-related protein [Stylonychia lemnae]|eukprot:CDW83466.1 ldlcp-related protein [Stylonychia lemnae]